MVKFFEFGDGWKKWNWVSDSERIVGFGAYNLCCEVFDYYYTNKIGGKELKTYYKKIHKKLETGKNNFELDEVFIKKNSDKYDDKDNRAYVKIIDKDTKELVCFLVIYNQHNGYYYHNLCYKTINDEVETEAL